ncbi:MAG: SusC/RagA family TonB-linked outer membrane protein [Prolixibacteraceae bacterium]
MKLTLFFLLAALVHVSASVYSQQTKLSVSMKDAKVKEVLKQIEDQTDFSFLYKNDNIDLNRIVSVDQKEKSVENLLDLIFLGTTVTFEVVNRQIVLVDNAKENFLPSSEQQQKKISGKISDSAGSPLPGVSVVVKGTTNGVITDVDGNFTIGNIGENSVLQFSFVGMKPQEISVAGKTVLKITLLDETVGIEEVVAIGYGTAKKSDLTGAITQVKADNLKIFTPSNVSDLLRTSIPGLNAGYSSTAKDNSSLLIRGETTLTAGSSPLIVLDGVIYSGDLSDINPDDIDRMDIMKDASSAAVYGSRATNGVISITTKKGKGDKPTINVSTTFGLSTPANRIKPYDANGFMRWRSDMFKSVFSATVPQKPWSPFDDPRTIDQQYLSKWFAYYGTNEANKIDAWLSGLRLTGKEIENYKAGKVIDWEDIIYQIGKRQDYNVSLSGKKNDFTYYWSLGYMNNEALTIGDKFSTIRSRVNLEGQVTKFLKVGLNAQFSFKDQSSVPANNDQYMNLTPYSSYYANDNTTLRLYPNDDIMGTHPLLDRNYREREMQYYTFFPKIYSVLDLPFGITYTMNLTANLDFYHNYVHDSSAHPLWSLYGGSATRESSINRQWQIDNIFNWNRTLFDLHKIDITFLANAEKIKLNTDGMTNRTFSPNDILGYHNMSTGTLPVLSSNDEVQSADALMARLNYGFNKKYLLTLSVRRDGSSLFGYSNPRANFPSAAIGWVATEEGFFKSKIINYLKFRASWGINGNRSITNYAALSRIAAGKTLNADQSGTVVAIPTLVITTMENKNLKWERTEAINFGVDYNLLNGILTGSIEAYSMSTTDVLVNRLLPTITGFDRVYANLGNVKNKGLELSLNSLNLKHGNFEWKSNLIVSVNRNTIVSITGDKVNVLDKSGNVIGQKESDDKTNNWFIGQSKDVIWDYKILGTWKTGQEAEAAKWNQSPGDFRLQDVNGDGLMTDDDKQFQGYRTPRFSWTLTNSFKLYKNIEASFVIYSLWGQKSPYALAKHDDHIEDRKNSWDVPYWTPENQIDNYARLRSAPAKGVSYTAWFDRSYIRLENVAIAYRMPKSLISKTFISDMKVTFNIRNAGLYAPEWKFGDPEDGTRAQRIFSLGLNLSL